MTAPPPGRGRAPLACCCRRRSWLFLGRSGFCGLRADCRSFAEIHCPIDANFEIKGAPGSHVLARIAQVPQRTCRNVDRNFNSPAPECSVRGFVGG